LISICWSTKIAFASRAVREKTARDPLFRSAWVALRTLEERTNMLAALAREERAKGRDKSVDLYEARAAESKAHTQSLRDFLVKSI
jgi:two-component system chemotaxis response regulator CheB